MARSFELRREVALDATAEQVWEAIATGPGLAAWFMPMEVDPDSGMVTAWEPGRRLAVRTPAAADGTTQAFEYVIEAAAGGSTVLRFVHSGFLGDDWGDEYEPMTAAGWDMYLHTLAQYFTHFAGRRAVYAEAEGPPASAGPDAWTRLLARLDLRSPELGAPVHVALPGAPPVTGTVDYVTDRFVGLRTDDALVRFHGRWAIGMTVAVSHHAYGAPADPARLAEAWTAWLATALG